MLRLKIIACDIFNREITYLASQSKCYTDITFLHQGLHQSPEKLRESVQAEVDKANEGFPYNYYNTAPDYDYIIVGYGLCSNGIAGISSAKVPMAIPRGHDCITMLLGSKEQYRQRFDSNPGTYWFSAGWIERAWKHGEEKYKVLLREYTEKYGEDNAEYLMEMEQKWMKEYKKAALVYWDSIPNADHYRDVTRSCSEYFGWGYLEFKGSSGLLDRMLNGHFDKDEVLVVPPGKKVVQSCDEMIIGYE